MQVKKKLIKKYLKRDGTLKLSKTSISMLPKIQPGQKITIDPTAMPKFGDIVLYLSNNQLVLHRYYFKIWEKAITKGDNNGSFDRPWKFINYIGKAKVTINFKERLFVLKTIILRLFKKTRLRQYLVQLYR